MATDFGFEIDEQMKLGLRANPDAPGATDMTGLRPTDLCAQTPLPIEIVAPHYAPVTITQEDLDGAQQYTFTVVDPCIVNVSGTFHYKPLYTNPDDPTGPALLTATFRWSIRDVTNESHAYGYGNISLPFGLLNEEKTGTLATGDVAIPAGTYHLVLSILSPPYPELPRWVTFSFAMAKRPGSQSWPWPQVIPMRHDGALYATANGLFWMDTSYLLTPITATGLTHHGLWHVADFGGSWYACNGVGLISHKRASTLTGYEDTWTAGNYMSVCNHQDHRLLTVWIDTSGHAQLTYSTEDGAGLSVPIPMDTTSALILPMDHVAVIYGTNGAVGVRYAAPSGLIEYGFEPIPEIIGVYGRQAAACVCEDYQIVSDTAGVLWRVNPDFSVHRLDYQEWLGNNSILTADQTNREVWIASDTKSYVLTENAYAKGHALGGPMAHRPNGFLSGLKSVGPGVQAEVNFQSGTFDCGRRSEKSFFCAHVASQNITGLTVQYIGRTDTNQNMARRSATVRCAPSGTAFPTALFVEGQVIIHGNIVDGKQGRIANAELRYRTDDRRDRSGPIGQPEQA